MAVSSGKTRRAATWTAAATLALAALFAAATATPRAAASVPPLERGQLAQLFDAAGNPRLLAYLSPTGGLAATWSRCEPGAAVCAPTGATGTDYEPGPTSAGTEFVASGAQGGTVYLARSTAWLGTVAATTPPALSGAPRVGRRVTPTAGTWTGGWGGELDHLSVEACRTPDARGCTTIAHQRAVPTPGGSIVLDPRWTGRYLFAVDERIAAGTAFPAIAILDPAALGPARIGPTVARSAAHGPVSGPGPVTIRRQAAELRGGRLAVARATCRSRCLVVVTVTAGLGPAGSAPRGAPSSRLRVRFQGTRRLAVPRGELGLAGGLHVRVRIGSAPAVVGVIPPAR